MNRKPKYLEFSTLDEEKYNAQFYRIPLSAIEAYDFEQTSISYSYDTIWSAEEITKIYTHKFVFITKQTSEVIAFRDALDRKETLFFVTIDYDDGTSISVFDNEDGFEQWRKNETDEGITFFLYCRKK